MNGQNFNNILQWMLFNEKILISFKISLKFVPKGVIGSKSPLVQVMA